MTDIKLFKEHDVFVGFECSGHTGYNTHGKDILCATISGISQSVILGLEKVCNIKTSITRRDKDGYIKVIIPLTIARYQVEQAQILFETFKASIEDLLSGYSKYISMEVTENVY